MGDCKRCGKPAGFLRSVHKECEASYTAGKSEIAVLVRKAAHDAAAVRPLKAAVEAVATKSFLRDADFRATLVDSWGMAVAAAFEDGVLSEEEETNLGEVRKLFGLEQSDLDHSGAFTKVVKGAVLRDLLNGQLPERVSVEGNLPFNFQKEEKLVWLFQGVEYYEQKTRRHYEGRSSGVSIRIAKGVYYRTGAFRGHPVETQETVHVDTGALAFTNKHLYFAGNGKALRIPYKKIVSFAPYSDGLGIQRDAATAKPQTFITGDGWFTYNLAVNLGQL